MRLANREEEILDFIIRDYIRSAFPVSSSRIFDEADLEVSPATIRNSMSELDEAGYLTKPHTSAGRVPTDKAYRYFVDFLMEKMEPEKKVEELFDGLLKKMEKRHELLFENFGRMLSEELGLFSMVASFGSNKRISAFGYEEVMKEPEFEDRNLALEFARLVDHIDLAAPEYLEQSSEEPNVFIGEENPVKSANSFSSISMRFSDGKSGKCVMVSFGPKRMNYERASYIMDFLSKDFNDI